jgi:hypothetical protein
MCKELWKIQELKDLDEKLRQAGVEGLQLPPSIRQFTMYVIEHFLIISSCSSCNNASCILSSHPDNAHSLNW